MELEQVYEDVTGKLSKWADTFAEMLPNVVVALLVLGVFWFWVDHEKHPDFLDARSEAVLAIKKAFSDNDIVIPFPIRTLEFGIRGGKSLADALPSKEAS